MDKQNLCYMPSGDVLTKEQSDSLYDLGILCINIEMDELILNKLINSIEPTTYLIKPEEKDLDRIRNDVSILVQKLKEHGCRRKY